MSREALLACGILSSLLYVVADVLGGAAWPAYSHASQGVSELMAINAPSRAVVLSVMTTRNVLLVAVAIGVFWLAGKSALRVTAILLVADAVLGQITATVFPVPQRGGAEDATMHLIGTGVETLAILLAIGFAAAALEGAFRLYSVGTLVVLLGFGAWAGVEVPRVEAQLPTPWLGIIERVGIYGYVLWVAVLAIALLRCRHSAADPR